MENPRKPAGRLPLNLTLMLIASAVIVPVGFFAGAKIDAVSRGKEIDPFAADSAAIAVPLPPSPDREVRARRRATLLQEVKSLEWEREDLEGKLERVRERMSEGGPVAGTASVDRTSGGEGGRTNAQ